MTRQRTRAILVLLGLGALALWAAMASTTAAARPPGDRPPKVAGSFYLDQVDNSATIFKGLITFHADGTLLATDTVSFGASDDPFSIFSAQFGTWRRTGRREITWTSILFAFDHEGIQQAVARFESVVTFGPRFHTLSAVFTARGFLPDQDPLGPDEEPFLEVQGTYSGRRISVR